LEPGEPCLVVLGDTIFEFSKERRESFEESFVLTAPVEEAARWCLADVASGSVRQLADKPAKNPGQWPALIGVYFLRDPQPARASLEAALKDGSGSLQLRHALQPYISAGQLRAHPAGQWLDCGNVDFLTSSRRR